jgi:predicted branched-subunit amino acid permease
MLIAWVMIAAFTGLFARGKGFSFGWYFFMCLVGGPIQTLVTLNIARKI